MPVIRKFCDRLGLASIVNDYIPLSPQAPVGLGETMVALVMNKLTDPQPLYQLELWAEEYGSEQLLGIRPDELTDDRVGRLLDQLAENAESIKAAVCLRAVEVFGLDVGRIHWDITTVEFEGSYDNQDSLWPLLTYGYDPRGSGKHKQVRVANLVVGDGEVGGLLHKTYPGNTNDVNTVTDYLSLFCELRDRLGKPPRLVGDSKLLSHAGMVKLEEAGLHWICPEAHSPALDEIYGALPPQEWVDLAYVSRRQSLLPAEEQTIYRGQETSAKIEVPEEPGLKYARGTPKRTRKNTRNRRVYDFRRLIIFSSEVHTAQRTNRQRQRERLEAKLQSQKDKFASAYWKRQSEHKAQRSVERILESTTVGSFYHCQVKRREDDQAWGLTWTADVEALKTAERLDGYYTLLTNVPRQEADIHAIFRDYKAQSAAERRFADWKGPLKVRPMFIKNNKRIVGLVLVLAFALLIFSLIERETRHQLKDRNESMRGLLPVNRPVRATGRNVLRALSSLTMVGIRTGGRLVWRASRPNSVQAELLGLLGVDLQQMISCLSRPREP